MFPGLKEIVDLLDEAEEARELAAAIGNEPSARDLLQYAAALEAEAARLDVHTGEFNRDFRGLRLVEHASMRLSAPVGSETAC